MAHFETSSEVVKSLAELLDYLAYEEREDFENHPASDHIFVHAMVVQHWLNREESKYAHCARCGVMLDREDLEPPESWDPNEEKMCFECKRKTKEAMTAAAKQ